MRRATLNGIRMRGVTNSLRATRLVSEVGRNRCVGWTQSGGRIFTLGVSQLSAYASEAIQKSAKFSLVSPSESSRQNGIVVLRLPNGFKGIDLYHRLREKDDMLVSPVDHPRDLRVCLHFFNTESEFDALLGRLEVYCA